MSGVGITEASGKIGGTTISKSQSGLSIRSGKQKLKGRSTKAVNQSGRLALLQQRYRALTVANRRKWEKAAADGWYNFKNKMGEPIAVTGLDLFIHINQPRGVSGLNYVTLPRRPQPFPIITESFSFFRSLPLSTVMRVTNTASVNATYQRAIWATAPMSAGINRPKGFRFLGIFQGTTLINFGNQYQAVFGLSRPGSKVFVKVFYIGRTDGLIHEVLMESRISTA